MLEQIEISYITNLPELNEVEAFQYCPEVPFNREVKYCYPEVKLDYVDTVGLSFLGIVAIVAVIINLMDTRG